MVLLKAEVTVLLDTIQAEKWEAQSREGTMVVPSCVPTSWQRLHAADSLTTRAKSSNELTSVRRNFLLMRPKQASGENLVWPVPCNSPFLFVIGFILLNNQVSDIQPSIAHYVGSLLYCCINIVEDSNIICGGGRYLRPLRGKRSV